MSFIGRRVSRALTARPSSQHMRDWCAARTTAEALEALDAAGLPAGPIYTPQQALDDPQVAAMEFLHAIADYPGLHRARAGLGLACDPERNSGGITQRAAAAGRAHRAMLAELGYAPARDRRPQRDQGVV